jgi:hypothetical protein
MASKLQHRISDLEEIKEQLLRKNHVLETENSELKGKAIAYKNIIDTMIYKLSSFCSGD